MARLFFAVWPGTAAEALAKAGASLADLAQGRPVPVEKIHLTLAFLGEITPEEAGEAVEAAEAVEARKFTVSLDCVGSFRQARVAWAGANNTPPALEALQGKLARELRAREFRIEDRPFVPHVTLVRRIGKLVPRAAMPPIEWKADELTLVQAETGKGSYRVLETWKLR